MTSWSRRRVKIFRRDGWRCVSCGATERLTVDHIRARSAGGTDALWNLQTLCYTCNNEKARWEARLALERPGRARIHCRIRECPWCFGRRQMPRRFSKVVQRG